MKWKFKQGIAPQGSSDGFWYDIGDGGYINPQEILDDTQQIQAVIDAVALLHDFEQAMEDAGLLNEF